MKKKNRIECAAMSLVMLLTMMPNSISLVKAADSNQNLALNKNATASSFEVASTNAAKATDGKLNTRWGTAQNKASGEWLEVDLGSEQTIQQINVLFERSDAEQNILGYKVDVYNGTTYETVYTKNEKAKQREEVILSKAMKGTKVKVTILNADGGTLGWLNAGIAELEVYDHQMVDAEDEENVNHIANAAMSASNVEENLAKLGADKANDGDRTTRWASNYDAPSSQWLKATFTKPTKLQQFNIHFLNRDVAPNDSNVKKFNIRYTDENGVVKYAVQDYQNVSLGTGKGYQTDVKIVLDDPIIAKDVMICEFDASATTYNNISITEFEAYSNKVSDRLSLDEVVASIKGKGIAADVTQLPMPSVPEGFNVKFHGADFEQIIADDGTIIHPLTDKLVKLSFDVEETKTEKVKNTGDLDFTIKGKYTQANEKNTKPVIMPEIAEWYSESSDVLNIASLDTVVYDDAALETTVDEFIRDYEEFTGNTLHKVQDTQTRANAFHFQLHAPDALLGTEGYLMDIQSDRMVIASVSSIGNMYGMQTILQMYKTNQQGYPVGMIRDYPRFLTRGFLLDVARKPISMDMLKDMSRTMRYYKMNDFQIHLSDNYIFLEKYGVKDKELEAFNAYDAFRLESSLTNAKGESPTALDYAYKKEEFKTFITEERESGMKIIPEIDVPAHASSFTKIWPEIMVKGKVSPMTSTRPLIDHIDVSKPEAMDKIEEIFDDYTKGNDPVFDADTTVHIGADEFLADYTAYRKFVNELVPYVKDTNTVRMWGGLTWIDDGKTEIIPEAINNVEVNLWSSDWADGMQMYNMGYKLINTIDDYGYMVPNGSLTRANSYGDLLNINRIYDSFEANRVKTKSGYKMIPSGDDQVLGAAFAMWHDNIDKDASGLSESDMFYRFFDAMPFYAEKTWAATGKEKGNSTAVSSLSQQLGIGPNSNPYSKEEKVGSTYESYDFTDDGLQDTSGNERDLAPGNAVIENNALTLQGRESYVTSPIDEIGINNTLSFDITLSAPGQPGQILFERDAPYGTQDIRIMSDGTLGFTRELYEYSFDYTLPVGKAVHIEINNEQQKTELYIDGTLAGKATGKYIDKGIQKKTNISNATFALPIQRIGSSTNAIQAVIDNVIVSEKTAKEDVYQKVNWTGKTNTETNYNEREGLLKYAFDNKANTIWHSNWQGATDKLNGTNSFYAELDLGDTFTINQFSFTPRQDVLSGVVTNADLFIKEKESDEWKQVAVDQTFTANSAKKIFQFDEQDVRYVKFVAKQSNDGWVAVSEFDVDNKLPSKLTVYVQSDGNGIVTGNQDVNQGDEVTILAQPATGYQFKGWYDVSGKLVSNEASYTFIVNTNIAYTAQFEKCTYQVSIDGNTQDVLYGDKVEVTAPSKPGHKWLGFFEENSDLPYDFTKPIDRNVTVTSRFEPYTITFLDSIHGELQVSEVNEQGEITLTAHAKEGYEFEGWYESGVLLSEDTTFTFIAEKDMTIAGIFKVIDSDDQSVWKQILSSAIQKAQKLEEEGALVGVHDKVKLMFRASLQEAIRVYGDVNASTDDMSKAWFNLAESMQLLDFKADKTKLENLFEEYRLIDLNLYKDDVNKAEFMKVMEQAELVINDEFALDERIEAMYQTLLNAKTNLQLKDELDVTLIDYFITQGDVILSKEAYYDKTDPSWNIFINALTNAKETRKAMNSQTALNEAAIVLADAYENIRLIANEDILAQLQSFLDKLRSIQFIDYSQEDIALFHQTENQIQQLLDAKTFTMKDYNDALRAMANTFERLEKGKLDQDKNITVDKEAPAKPKNSISSTQGIAKTGDQTRNGFFFSVMVASGCAALLLKRKNKRS